jgi:glycolate oxidase iron-sulfur subunit
MREIEGKGLDAVIVTTSAAAAPRSRTMATCCAPISAYAEKAARVSALAMDVSEFLAKHGLPAVSPRAPTVAYHPPCSLQHGQKVDRGAERGCRRQAGFTVRPPAEAHRRRGSAGTYNILQSELASQLGARKAERLGALQA